MLTPLDVLQLLGHHCCMFMLLTCVLSARSTAKVGSKRRVQSRRQPRAYQMCEREQLRQQGSSLRRIFVAKSNKCTDTSGCKSDTSSVAKLHGTDVPCFTKFAWTRVRTTPQVCSDCLMRFISYIALQQGCVVSSTILSHSFGGLSLYRLDCVQGVRKIIHNIVLGLLHHRR